MTPKKIIIFVALLLVALGFSFMPSRYWMERFSGSPAKGGQKPAPAAAVQKKPSGAARVVKPLTKKKQPPARQQPAPKQAAQQGDEIEMLDSLDEITAWKLENNADGSSMLGTRKGIVGNALAVYYSLSKNGWALLSRKGSWNFSSYQGLQFSVKIDGQPTRLTLILQSKGARVFERNWDPKDMKGVDWKLLRVSFSEISQSAQNSYCDTIQIKLSSQNEAKTKGRILFDSMGLIR